MLQSIEAIIDEKGNVKLLEDVHFSKAKRAIVTILDNDTEKEDLNITAILSEKALEKDWNRPEEDKAWAHLQKAQ